MSFSTQRLANSYPLWTKLRRDPSSVGQRYFSTFATALSEREIFNVRLMHELGLFKRELGPGHLYRVPLAEADYFVLSNQGGGSYQYVLPATVVGNISATPYTLDKYDTIHEMITARPDRLESSTSTAYSSFVCWDSSAPDTYVDPVTTERLYIEITNGLDWYKKTGARNQEKSGFHRLVLRGTDEDDNEFTEVLNVVDDGIYVTRSFYKTLIEVWTEGFDSDVVIKWFPFNLAHETDPYRVLVLDTVEGQLKLRPGTRVVGGPTYSYVVYELERLKNGVQYRMPGVTVHENTEEFGQCVLLDSGSSPYTAVDLAINPRNSKLCVLDSSGFVHTYEHAPTPFSTFSLDVETTSSYIELHPLQHYANYGVSEKVFTYFSRVRFPIVSVEIKRVAPDTTTEYLQANKTWAVGVHSFSGTDTGVPDTSWRDITFETTYDQLGQWEYYCTTVTELDTTVYATAVMVDSIVAESSIDSGVVSPVAIGFVKNGELAVADATDVYTFVERVDGWIPDYDRQQLITIAPYDDVDVTY